MTHRDVDNYAFWPSKSIKPQNEIASALQSAFWEQMPRCPRKVFLSSSSTPVPISSAIFDTRGGADRRTNVDPVASLVIRARPTNAIVSSPVVIHGLNPATQQKNTNFVCLTPEYVRRLLRETSIEGILNNFPDTALKSILLFILDRRSIETLKGCYILRLADGKIAKIAKNGDLCGLRSAKGLYIVDKEGLRLFKALGADCIISPDVVDKDVLARLELEDTINVRQVNSTVVEMFLQSTLGEEENVRTYNDTESAWLLALYNYVNAHKFTVTSYETHPMLPLSNKGGKTFVSIKFWNDPKLLPPITDPNHRRITEQFPDIHILANLDLPAMNQLVTTTSAQRFLEFLYSLVKGDARALEMLLQQKKLLTDSSIEVQTQLRFFNWLDYESLAF